MLNDERIGARKEFVVESYQVLWTWGPWSLSRASDGHQQAGDPCISSRKASFLESAASRKGQAYQALRAPRIPKTQTVFQYQLTQTPF